MSGIYYTIYSFLIYCLLFVYVFLILRGYQKYKKRPQKVQEIIYGVAFGFGGILTNSVLMLLKFGTVGDGKFVMITISTLFFGPISGVITFLVMAIYMLALGRAAIILYLLLGGMLIGTTTILMRLLKFKVETPSYRVIAIVSVLNSILLNMASTVIFPEYDKLVEMQKYTLLESFQYMLLMILLASIIKREISNEGYITALLVSKTDLEAQNEEIRALYEEMAAAEETLQINYDELNDYRWKLEESEKRYGRVITAGEEGFFDYYPVTKAWFVSNRFCEIFGYEEASSEQVTRSFFHRLGEDNEEIQTYFEDKEKWKQGEILSRELQILCSDEVYRWVQFKAIAEKDEFGKLMRITGSILDINQRKIEQEKVEFYAFHDPVTGFLNEDYFVEAVQALLQKPESNMMLLYVGIYDFSHLSAIYGSKIAEIVQYQLGINIHQIFDNVLTYSHIRPGVFGVLIEDSENQMAALKSKIKTLNQCYETDIFIGNYNINISLMYPFCLNEGNLTIEEIMEHIEVSYEYCVEHKIVGRLEAFNTIFYEHKTFVKQVSNYLFKAISEDLFTVVYQPQIEKGQVVGMEALVRLSHPELGMIPPDEFIPIAEDMGIIHQIDQNVMIKALKYAEELNEMYNRRIRISINLSFLDLMSEPIVDEIIEIYHQHKSLEGLVSFEITETAISKYLEGVQANLSKISEHGILLELDDFGTGYSSLKHLGQLPVEVVKIDKAFVKTLGENDKMLGLVELMINVGHLLNLKVIAEGIEEREQFEILEGMNCDRYQGYYFSKPLSPEAFEAFVAHFELKKEQ